MTRQTRQRVNGDTGEVETAPLCSAPLDNCFITRLDGDLLEMVLAHQAALTRVFGKPVSRAAAVREVLRRALPRRRAKSAVEQLDLFGVRVRRDETVRVDAQAVVAKALARVDRAAKR